MEKREKTHWFHLLLDLKTISALIAVMANKQEKIQRFIVRIIEKFYWFIEEFHFTGPDQGCRHKKISEDMQDKRVDLWLPLVESVYQRLKQVHKDLDSFSIAGLVRVIIHMYLKMREKMSEAEVMLELDAKQAKWNETRTKLQLDPQLHLPLLGLAPDKSSHKRELPAISKAKLVRYLVIYDNRAKAVAKLII